MNVKTELPLCVLGLLVLGGWHLGAADRPNSATNTVPLFPDEVVAKGKGFEIRRSEVDDAVAGFRATLASQNQSFPDSDREAVAAHILDSVVLTRILMQRATDADRKQAKELAEKLVAETRSRASSEEAYRRQLRATGITAELFAARALEQATVNTVVNRELRSTLAVSDDQVRDFYDRGVDVPAREVQAVVDQLAKTGPQTAFYTDGKHKLEEITKANLARLDRPDQVRANLIVLSTVDRLTRQDLPAPDQQAKHELAEKVLARLKAGEDWAKLARESSDDPEGQRTSGEYTIVKGAPTLPELAELKGTLFEMPVNEIRGPITNKLGFYLVRVLERTAAGKVPFDKAATDIRELLLNQEMQKRLPDYSAKLKKEYEVEVHLLR